MKPAKPGGGTRHPDGAAAAESGSHVRPTMHDVRILLIDRHTVLREGVGALIALETDLRVVGQAASLADGVGRARELQPDLIVADASLHSAADVQLLLQLRQHCPSARFLVLTAHGAEEHIRAALAAGVDGYVLKDASRGELIYALRAVLDGQRYLCARSSAQVVSSYLGESQSGIPAVHGITDREREILSMIAKGLSNKRIANALRRSVKTVEKHRANLMRKLGLHNLAQVTRFALQSGVLSSDYGLEPTDKP